MIEITSCDEVKVTGRGKIALVDLSNQKDVLYECSSKYEYPIKVGDIILLDGRKVEVRGIEGSRALMSPPFIKPGIGILYREQEVVQNE